MNIFFSKRTLILAFVAAILLLAASAVETCRLKAICFAITGMADVVTVIIIWFFVQKKKGL